MEGKVAAITKFGRPKTKREVRSFLGMCGYYRKFIDNFATIATPRSNLTRKQASDRMNWGRDCQEVFDQLKKALTEAPVLVTPDWSRSFILQTDTSAYGLGYVLSQLNSKEEHPIAYASKKLLPSKWNYLVIEWEALAMMKGVKHFRTYLEGNPFIIQITPLPT